MRPAIAPKLMPATCPVVKVRVASGICSKFATLLISMSLAVRRSRAGAAKTFVAESIKIRRRGRSAVVIRVLS
jgi:hypothetical protein